MKTIEYATLDKSAWPDGPWKSEPDKIQFTDEKTGLPCLIVRHPRTGYLCGYVGVSAGHPYFERDPWGITDDDDGFSADVHGGITFAKKCQPGDEATTICHLVEDGEDDDVWWIGFDCGHLYDLEPSDVHGWGELLGDNRVYRGVPFVKDEIASLAQQLAAKA